jgi:hypothetical protein
MSTLYVDSIQPKTTGGNVTITNQTPQTPVEGSIVKMLYTQFDGTNTFVAAANTDVVLTDLTVTVTPTSATSKFRLEGQVYGEWSNRNSTWDSTVFFYRDTTKLAHPQAGSRNCGVGGMFLSHESDSASTPEGSAMFQYFDAPNTTSSITYKVGIRTSYAGTLHLNSTVAGTDAGNYERFVSSICVTEIKGA